MNCLKAILVILALTFTLSHPSPLFDLNEMFEQGTLMGFLQLTQGGAPVSVEECMPDSIFKATNMDVNPKEIIKGQSIKIKVDGAMTTDQIVHNLHLDTFYNGKVIYTQDVDQKDADVKMGIWGFNYEAAVPTFTPSGKWEIFIYITNKANEKLSCIKASFTMP